MKCVRCGKQLDDKDVYCYYCGTLNINNPKNKVIKDMINDKQYQYDEKNTWYAKVNQILNNSTALFILLNVIATLLSIPIFKYIFSANYNIFFWDFIIIFNIYRVFIELLFKKAKLPWWGILVPIYDIYLLFKLAFGKGLLFIVIFIPIFLFLMAQVFMFSGALMTLGGAIKLISTAFVFIISLVILFLIGKRFGRSGIITILFFYIIIPSIAISKKYEYIEPLNDKQ